jgi:hypothetical protein
MIFFAIRSNGSRDYVYPFENKSVDDFKRFLEKENVRIRSIRKYKYIPNSCVKRVLGNLDFRAQRWDILK